MSESNASGLGEEKEGDESFWKEIPFSEKALFRSEKTYLKAGRTETRGERATDRVGERMLAPLCCSVEN